MVIREQAYKYTDFDTLWDRLSETILTNRRHKHYDHTVEVAEQNYSFMTGDNQEEVVISYREEESDEQKTQAIKLYNSLTQYVCSRVYHQFKPINRPDIVNEEITISSENEKVAIEEINFRRKHFYHGLTLDQYLDDRYLNLIFYDPNAWVVAELDNFDPDNTKPFVYPVEVFSDQAIDYEYDKNILQQLTVRQQIVMYDEDGKEKTGFRYIIYAPNMSIVAHQFMEFTEEINQEMGSQVVFNKGEKDEMKFWVTRYETKSKITPAMRVGYAQDPRTKGETYVSPLYPAEKILKDLIFSKREKDLAKALHGFLQKFIMAQDCDYETDLGACTAGELPDGSICPKCNGSGLAIHQTVQDVVVIQAPVSKEQHIPLDQWVHYVEIPEFLVEMNDKDIGKLEIKVSEALFNQDVFTQTGVVKTAFEKMLDNESVNDVLYNASAKKAAFWKFLIHMIAIHTQNDEGLELVYDHERDFRLESLNELLQIRNMMIKSKSPSRQIRQLDDMISRKQKVSEVEIVNQNIKSSFHPFVQMTEKERMVAVNSLPRDSHMFIEWLYHDKIFKKIDIDYPGFYEFPQKERQMIYEEIVEEFVANADVSRIQPIPRIPSEEGVEEDE